LPVVRPDKRRPGAAVLSTPFPFSALVGQDEMKLALLAAAIDPAIGGVLVFGDRGTGKSTAVRALAGLLPPMRVIEGCRYGCDPDTPGAWCADCRQTHGAAAARGAGAKGAGTGAATPKTSAAKSAASKAVASKRGESGTSKGAASGGARAGGASTVVAPAAASLRVRQVPVPVVDLPLGATEDRVVGALDLERALAHGEKAFEPGLLARANRGFLYVDEVNLLEDHLVDLLIDVAASGENVVEREGLSVRHPARFVLIGSGNPEEGELRPQLLDRFGLSVEVRTPEDLPTRIEVVRRRDEFEQDPAAFAAKWRAKDSQLRSRLVAARGRRADVRVPDAALERAAQLCMKLGTDGLRGELTLVRAARALASFEGADTVGDAQLRRIAPAALRHRLRRDPLDESGSTLRVERAIAEVFGP
jgi:magnesium chelatase subunit I